MNSCYCPMTPPRVDPSDHSPILSTAERTEDRTGGRPDGARTYGLGLIEGAPDRPREQRRRPCPAAMTFGEDPGLIG
jgi:hypothetical protein